MKIVCICENEASANCVTSGLIGEHEIPLLIVPDFSAPKPPSRSKKKKRSKKSLVSKAFGKLFFSVFPQKASRSKIRDEIQRRGSGELDPNNSCSNIKTIPAHEINSDSTAELIAKHEPDILFAVGAPILKDKIFDIPKYCSVNFHYGYSPK